jgi:hypothetical protein
MRMKQIRAMMASQKQLYDSAADDHERYYLAGLWIGCLNGLRLTNAITQQEYQELYNEMQQHEIKARKAG